MITTESLQLLRSELDTDNGRHAGVDMSTSDGIAEHLQGLQATVQAQAEQIAKLVEKVEHLSGQLEQAIKALPPARAEDLEEPEPDQEPEEKQRSAWWRRLLRL
jgi:seryl-tRNA synthetase